MADSRLPKTLFSLVTALAIAESIRVFRLLPDRLASHFTAGGFANNWMEKPQFFALYGGLIVLSAAIAFLSLPLISITPTWAFNLPNKQHWLAPNHIQDTFAYLDAYFAWSGLALLLLEVFTMHLVFEANLQPVPRLRVEPVFLLLSLFVGLSAVSTIMLVRRFSRKPPDDPSLGSSPSAT